MAIVIHTDLLDTEVSKAIKDAIEGEIRSITRDELSKLIRETVAEKIQVAFSDARVQEVVKSVVREKVEKAIGTGLEFNPTNDQRQFTTLLKNSINEIIERRLDRGKLF